MPTPISTTLPSVSQYFNMIISFRDFFLYFLNQDLNNEGEQEDLIEYMEKFNFAVDGPAYTNENQKLTAI